MRLWTIAGGLRRIETIAKYCSLISRLSFHSEGRIVRHIFLLLFWSIIFQPVEGAFETAYQVDFSVVIGEVSG